MTDFLTHSLPGGNAIPAAYLATGARSCRGDIAKPPPFRVLITTDSIGELWQSSIDLAEALAVRGLEPVVAHLGPAPSDAQRAKAAASPGVEVRETGLPLDWLCDSAGPVLEAGAALTQFARDEQIDLIHLHSPALAASAPSGIPTVVGAHGCVATAWAATKPGVPLPSADRWHHQLTGEGLRTAARVVAPSRAFARQVARVYGLRETPAVVHNGRQPYLRRDSVAHDCAFTAGRLWDATKNAALLDRVAGLLAVPFHAAGDLTGPNGGAVVCANLHELGQLSHAETGRWLSRRPVFVSAAAYDPLGLSVLEAATAGCPLVLSDIPTFRELWIGAAVFAEAQTPAAYAWAIESIIADPPFRHALGQAAATRAAAYSVSKMADAMIGIYVSALEADRPRWVA